VHVNSHTYKPVYYNLTSITNTHVTPDFKAGITEAICDFLNLFSSFILIFNLPSDISPHPNDRWAGFFRKLHSNEHLCQSCVICLGDGVTGAHQQKVEESTKDQAACGRSHAAVHGSDTVTVCHCKCLLLTSPDYFLFQRSIINNSSHCIKILFHDGSHIVYITWYSTGL